MAQVNETKMQVNETKMQVNETVKNQSSSNGARGPPMMMTAFALTGFILTHPVAFMNHRKMSADEQQYVRPPRQYELPSFREGMNHLHLKRAVPQTDEALQPPRA